MLPLFHAPASGGRNGSGRCTRETQVTQVFSFLTHCISCCLSSFVSVSCRGRRAPGDASGGRFRRDASPECRRCCRRRQRAPAAGETFISDKGDTFHAMEIPAEWEGLPGPRPGSSVAERGAESAVRLAGGGRVSHRKFGRNVGKIKVPGGVTGSIRPMEPNFRYGLSDSCGPGLGGLGQQRADRRIQKTGDSPARWIWRTGTRQKNPLPRLAGERTNLVLQNSSYLIYA